MKEKRLLVIFIAFVIFIIKPMGNSAELKPESQYVNKQIQKLLDKNPEKTGDDLKLANVFNEKRKTVSDAEIKEGTPDDEPKNQDKAQAAIDDFKEFARDYTKIADKLADAAEDLRDTEKDADVPVEKKYEAVTLLSKLEKSATLKDAEKALKAYDDFKKKLKDDGKDTTPSKQATSTSPSTSPPSTSAPTSPPANFPSSSPPLTDENKQDLKEILNILNNLDRKDSPEMDNLIDKILKNPKDVKKLSEALKEFSEEDYDDDDLISEFTSYFF